MTYINSISLDSKDDEQDENFDSQMKAIAGDEFFPLQEMEKHVVLLVGAGDIAQEVSRLGSYAGFIVDVLDTSRDLARPERFPAARQAIWCERYADIVKRYNIGPRHYIVVTTQSLESDLEVLRSVLHSSARYIGVHGDENKQEALFSVLRKDGVPAAELACICCPVGVPIGALHPSEIAISIIAELIAARSGCLTAPRSKKKSIRK